MARLLRTTISNHTAVDKKPGAWKTMEKEDSSLESGNEIEPESW